jgi:cell division protein FtsB
MRILTTVLAGLLLLLQYQLWFGEGGFQDMWELKQSRDAQRLENEELQERNAALEAEVLDLKQGLEAVEERARTEMGMIKTDEVFYQILSKPISGKDQTQAQRSDR